MFRLFVRLHLFTFYFRLAFLRIFPRERDKKAHPSYADYVDVRWQRAGPVHVSRLSVISILLIVHGMRKKWLHIFATRFFAPSNGLRLNYADMMGNVRPNISVVGRGRGEGI